MTAQHLTLLQGLSDKKELLKVRYRHEVQQFEDLGILGKSMKMEMDDLTGEIER